MLNEILADMGVSKSNPLNWLLNLFVAAVMLWMRMFFHYMG